MSFFGARGSLSTYLTVRQSVNLRHLDGGRGADFPRFDCGVADVCPLISSRDRSEDRRTSVSYARRTDVR